MKKRILIALFIITGVIFCSCFPERGWVYTPNQWKIDKSTQKTIAIKSFVDARENKNSHLLGLRLIPGFPFGWQKLNVPELTKKHVASEQWINYNPKDDFAKALAQELKMSGIFKDAFYDDRSTNTDYYIEGKIISTLYKGKRLSYCLSFYGSILWLIGAPSVSFTNDLCVELTCFNTNDNTVVFKKTYSAEKYLRVGWIYYCPSDFAYPKLLKGIYLSFIQELKNQVN